MNFPFSRTEKLLLLLGAALLLTFGTLSAGNHSLVGWWLQRQQGWEFRQLGFLDSATGEVRRQPDRESRFATAAAGTPAQLGDSFYTGQESAATILLEDGGRIVMGPDTLIRLAFETELGWRGISRLPEVEVISGRVSVQSASGRELRVRMAGQVQAHSGIVPRTFETAQPKAEPAPVKTPQLAVQDLRAIRKLVVLSPGRDARFSAQESGGRLWARIPVEVVIDPPGPALELRLVRLQESGAEDGAPLPVDPLQWSGARGRTEMHLDRPGSYHLRVSGVSAYRNLGFRVLEVVPGLSVPSPQVGGRSVDSNLYQGEPLTRFDISLHWDAVPGAREYRVRVSGPHTGSGPAPVRWLRTREPKVLLSAGRVTGGKLTYEVQALMPSGFALGSGPKEFVFNFSPPQPMSPAPGARLARPSDDSEGFLLTWRKTNFTSGYEVEVARDAAFHEAVQRRSASDNFLALAKLPSGTHWWRVRSLTSSGSASPFSRGRSFVVP